jgi:hypothetical protein
VNDHGTRLIAARDELLAVLVAAVKRRDQFPGLGWIDHERVMMLKAVNLLRAGSDPVTLAQIEHVETMACGHSDYARKFALYCAELAVYGPGRRVQP